MERSWKDSNVKLTYGRIAGHFAELLDRDMKSIAKADIDTWQRQTEEQGRAYATIRRSYGSVVAKFKPGESGNPNGRPKGSKNRLAEAFIEELANVFEEHGADVIEKVMQQRPSEYLRIAQAWYPKTSTSK